MIQCIVGFECSGNEDLKMKESRVKELRKKVSRLQSKVQKLHFDIQDIMRYIDRDDESNK